MFLNIHSYFSLRYGTLSIGSIVEKARSLGLPSLALTDINNTMGMIDFVKQCGEAGIQPIAGIEFRDADHRLLYTGIARNNQGFRELNEFLSIHNESGAELPVRPEEFQQAYLVYPSSSFPESLRENELIGIPP